MKERTVALSRRCKKPDCLGDPSKGGFGLCGSCYGMARRLVLEDLTSWEKLQESGRADKPRRNTKQWLLASK